MVDFSGFEEKKTTPEYHMKTDISGICDDCGSDSSGIYFREDNTLLLVCDENAEHVRKVSLNFE